MPPELPEAVFHRDGDRYVPTDLARGPWDPNAQHGGPCAALLADRLEGHDVGPPAHVARMTIELLRPIPMQPIELRARTLRPGKKVQLVEASVLATETEVVRATALRIRTEDIRFADPPGDRLTPGPSEQLRERFENVGGLNFGFAMDMSVASGEVGVPGRPPSGSGSRFRSSRGRNRRPSCAWRPPPTSATASAAPSPGTSTSSSTPI